MFYLRVFAVFLTLKFSHECPSYLSASPPDTFTHPFGLADLPYKSVWPRTNSLNQFSKAGDDLFAGAWKDIHRILLRMLRKKQESFSGRGFSIKTEGCVSGSGKILVTPVKGPRAIHCSPQRKWGKMPPAPAPAGRKRETQLKHSAFVNYLTRGIL